MLQIKRAGHSTLTTPDIERIQVQLQTLGTPDAPKMDIALQRP